MILGDVDYNDGPYTIVFLAGEIRVTFNIEIIDDNILEHNEIFSLDITSPSISSKVLLGEISQTRVTILNDDSKC